MKPLKKTSGQVSVDDRGDIDHPITRELMRINPELAGSSSCEICNGPGYMFDPLGGGRDRGAFILCECSREICRCDVRPPYTYYDREKNAMVRCPAYEAHSSLDRMEILQRKSGIPSRYIWKFISSIDMNNRSILFAVDHAVETIRKYGNGTVEGLYLHGMTGCGKTLLSCALLNEMIRLYRLQVKYAKISRDILGKLQASFNPNSESYGEGRKIEEELAGVDVLVIDDFGVHRDSPWVNLVLYDLIDARYEKNLLTILTSNEPMDSWKDISGGRVYSRLRQMCSEIHIEAPDYRLLESRSY